jgi:tetratricopeptide (TPR) repeat protein
MVPVTTPEGAYIVVNDPLMFQPLDDLRLIMGWDGVQTVLAPHSAIQTFQALIEEYQTTEYALKSYLAIGKVYVLPGNYDAALTSLNNLITFAPNQEGANEAHYQKGWVYLEMVLWGSAREGFEKISPRNRERYNIKGLSHELEAKTPL